MYPYMDYHNRLERTFNPPATNGNGYKRMSDADARLDAHKARLAARFRIENIRWMIALLVLAGGLWLVASAIDSGLDRVERAILTR